MITETKTLAQLEGWLADCELIKRQEAGEGDQRFYREACRQAAEAKRRIAALKAAPLCACGLHPQHQDGYCPAEQTARESHLNQED
jgi:hypothetical protein